MPNAVENSKSQSGPQALWIVGVPLLLAVVEIFHPHPHNLLELDVDTWLTVHYLQLPLFALAAMAVAALVRGRADIGAQVCRGAMFVFGVSFIAFDTAAGIVTGILVNAAHRSQVPALYRVPIDVVWKHPIVGGSSGAPSLLAVLGSIALSVGCVAGAFSLKRAGHTWPPAALLALSSFGISVFRTHAWPGGPLTFGGIAIAAAWLLWERRRASVLIHRSV
ncbi:MAG TPA: hypothetical protein VFD98_06315 [Terracidiphilus sp.]|nr:hypothetical protein [Terracidiphilus sp.]